MTCHVTCQNAGGYPRILYAVVCYYFSIIIKVSGATAPLTFYWFCCSFLIIIILIIILTLFQIHFQKRL